jgi:hypothetical protein
MSGTLGHLPRFMTYRGGLVAPDGAGVPAIADLACRGYEQIVVYADLDAAGTVDIEVYVKDEDNSRWITSYVATIARDVGYVVPVYGAKVRIAVRNFAGGVTTASIRVAGATPERTFGD